FVANASCTLTSPLSMLIDFTKPNETMSRVNPGYLTDFNASFTCSSAIDMHKVTCGALHVNYALCVPSIRAERQRLEACAPIRTTEATKTTTNAAMLKQPSGTNRFQFRLHQFGLRVGAIGGGICSIEAFYVGG